MNKTKAYAAASATSPLALETIQRRDTIERDVQIEIIFCGICHSDLHTVRDEWSSVMATTYPCVPGHEIVGKVTKVGSAVTKFKTGDLVGVGCMVDSDQTCPHCQADVEQFCANATFSEGISIPRSPRATITPSVCFKISSKLRIPSSFSIFEMI